MDGDGDDQGSAVGGSAVGGSAGEAYAGGCHCGAVRFRVRLTGGLAEARRCNCSYCRMRGAVALTAKLGDLEVLKGADRLTLYRFGSGTAQHHFCAICGIYTHHRRRSNPEEYGVNAACLDGISPFDFAEVPVNDGVHHAADGGEDGVAGVLRFVSRAKTPPSRPSPPRPPPPAAGT